MTEETYQALLEKVEQMTPEQKERLARVLEADNERMRRKLAEIRAETEKLKNRMEALGIEKPTHHKS